MPINYINPPVPTGFSAVGGTWDTGYVIRRDTDGSEFVWVPVEALPDTGRFGSKMQSFGVRDYSYSGSDVGHDSQELVAQEKSVQKYGGFYLSRYCLSMGADDVLHSVPDAMPHTGINRVDSVNAARDLAAGEASSHLPYAVEMDSALAWLIQSGKKDPSSVANAARRRDTRAHQEKITRTGSCESLYANGIYDLAGTVDEWTQDLTDGAFLWGCRPCAWPGTSRCYFAPYACYSYTGLRAALYIP